MLTDLDDSDARSIPIASMPRQSVGGTLSGVAIATDIARVACPQVEARLKTTSELKKGARRDDFPPVLQGRSAEARTPWPQGGGNSVCIPFRSRKQIKYSKSPRFKGCRHPMGTWCTRGCQSSP